MSVLIAHRTPRTSDLAGRAARIAQAIAASIRDAASAAAEAHERRAACHRLNEMSDHQLKDIGISRSDIHARVYGRGS